MNGVSVDYDVHFERIDGILRRAVSQIDPNGNVYKINGIVRDRTTDYKLVINKKDHYIQVQYKIDGTFSILYGYTFCKETKKLLSIAINTILGREEQEYNPKFIVSKLDALYSDAFNIFDLESVIKLNIALNNGSEDARYIIPKINRSMELFVFKFFLFKGINLKSSNIYDYFECNEHYYFKEVFIKNPITDEVEKVEKNKLYYCKITLKKQYKVIITDQLVVRFLESIIMNMHNKKITYWINLVDENGDELFEATQLTYSYLNLACSMIRGIIELEFMRPIVPSLEKRVKKETLQLNGINSYRSGYFVRKAVRALSSEGRLKVLHMPGENNFRYFQCEIDKAETVIMETVDEDGNITLDFNKFGSASESKDIIGNIIHRKFVELFSQYRYPEVLKEEVKTVKEFTMDFSGLKLSVDDRRVYETIINLYRQQLKNMNCKMEKWSEAVSTFIFVQFKIFIPGISNGEERNNIEKFFDKIDEYRYKVSDFYKTQFPNEISATTLSDLFSILMQYTRIFNIFNRELNLADSNTTRDLNRMYFNTSCMLINKYLENIST